MLSNLLEAVDRAMAVWPHSVSVGLHKRLCGGTQGTKDGASDMWPAARWLAEHLNQLCLVRHLFLQQRCVTIFC